MTEDYYPWGGEFTTCAPNGCVGVVLLPSNRFINKGLEAQSCDPQTQNCHPVFNLPPGIKTGIETVVNNTLERWHNNQCS